MPEDYCVQSSLETSPAKWHLAHTSWFFEHFILRERIPGYRPFHPAFSFLFNSYYNSVGNFHERAKRGLLSRPTIEEVYSYRAHVDRGMTQLLESASVPENSLTLGLHHEQQHQELLLMDIKHLFWSNPLRPIYNRSYIQTPEKTSTQEMIPVSGGTVEVGAGDGFSFDNEKPRFQTLLPDFNLGSRLVTNGEYLEFMAAGGYQNPAYWLSDGWASVQKELWTAPLYWEVENQKENWQLMTLGGMEKINEAEPVCHVSYFEADAYARWRGASLPTEFEWETAAAQTTFDGHFLEDEIYHPQAAKSEGKAIAQLYGDVWEWTQSAYQPYPGFRELPGALGEYNGKFMVNQMVLRGGSCMTPKSHVRASYRNFYPPQARWQVAGFRIRRGQENGKQ